jgi:hypothetical protein
MELFDFLENMSLKKEHFEVKTEHLIANFIPKRMVSIWYADGGSGKSYLAHGVVKHLLDTTTNRVVYLDPDNSISVLKDRGIDHLLVDKYPNLTYLHRSSMTVQAEELLEEFGRRAVGSVYKDIVFVIDSLKDVLPDMQNDQKVAKTMQLLMNMREAGATVLVLHHTNKDGKNYQGSNQIRNSCDVMYRLYKKISCDGSINFLMKVQKERACVVDMGWSLDIKTLTITPLNKIISEMNERESDFVTNVTSALREKELSLTELLKAIGSSKDDKTARELLDKFDGVFYTSTFKTHNRARARIFSNTTATTDTTTLLGG